ncbi:Hypothetical predicted protein, partial [Pelobates cultripes]
SRLVEKAQKADTDCCKTGISAATERRMAPATTQYPQEAYHSTDKQKRQFQAYTLLRAWTHATT